MARGFTYEYPPDEEIVRGAVEHGSSSRYAVQGLGIAASTLRAYLLRNPELKARVEEATRASQQLKSRPAPAPARPQPGEEVSVEEKLKQENRELQRALDQARDQDVREQRLHDLLTMSLPALKPRFKSAPRKVKRGAVKHEFVLLFSDLHAGELVSLEEMGGINSYTWAIMLERIRRLSEGVLSYREHRGFDIDTLHLLMLGDTVSGTIHAELERTNELPGYEAVGQVAIDLSAWIEADLIPEFARINAHSTFGNHGREQQKPQAKMKWANADRAAGRLIQHLLSKYDSFSMQSPKSPHHLVDVCGQRILMTHGDGVGPSSMVGVPTGGIVRYVGRLRNEYTSRGKPFQQFVCGHFHEWNVYKGSMFVNGCIVGPSEYGLQRFGESQPPQQLLLTYNDKWGFSDLSVIDLSDGQVHEIADRGELERAA